MATEWFRNNIWNDDIERAFFAKLQRARPFKRAQYLRIQVCHLTKTCPLDALRLLDVFFSMKGLPYYELEEAIAYVHKAEAHIALGDIPLAIQSYDMALQTEAKRPNVKTLAYLDSSFLVATHAISERYAQCLKLLDKHKTELMFPFESFLWHASRALILSDFGNNSLAKEDAKLALQAAEAKHSGFRYHSTLGLVGDQYSGIRKRLEEIATS